MPTIDLQSIIWTLPADEQMNHPYDFCISDVRPLLRSETQPPTEVPPPQMPPTQPPGTQPPGTQPPGTQPPGTQPPGTQPPNSPPPMAPEPAPVPVR